MWWQFWKHKDWLTPEEAADLMERFVSDKSLHNYEWSDFLEMPYDDPLINEIAEKCWKIHDEYPGDGTFCSDEGLKRIAELAQLLRRESKRADS